jgi:ATP-dependent DNA helicase RecG
MKVLGYVNCYNREINMVQDELEANGNGKAEFSFRLITAFEAKVALAGKGEGGVLPDNDPINDLISDPMLPESGTMNGTIDGTMALRIVSAIEKDPSVTMDQLSEKLGIARRSLVRYMNILQDNKRIRRVGGKRFGHWEVLA